MTKKETIRAERLGLEAALPSVRQALVELQTAVEKRELAPDLDWSKSPLVLEAIERHGAFPVYLNDAGCVLFSFRGRLFMTPGGGSPDDELAVALLFVLSLIAGRSNESLQIDEISQ